MPILVGETLQAPAPPPFVYDSKPTELYWVSASGRVTKLTDWQRYDSGITVKPGILGLGMPSYTFFSDASPVFDGELIRGVRADPRSITIPIVLWGPDRASCLNIFHSLVDDLDPKAGQGTLIVEEAGGTRRTIGAYYSDGMTGDDDDENTGRTWVTAVLVFRAPIPFWEGEEVSQTWRLEDSTGLFFPILPLRVTDSQVAGQVTARNEGNVEAYPTWTTTGPFTSFSAENQTYGQSFFINKTTIVGDVEVIDCRQGIKSAYLNGTVNLWEWMDIDSDLWALQPGDNQVLFTAPAATSASTVTMSYRPRYKTGY